MICSSAQTIRIISVTEKSNYEFQVSHLITSRENGLNAEFNFVMNADDFVRNHNHELNFLLPAHQHLDCLQLKWTIREMFPHWSYSRILWLLTWLQMINAAAQRQTTRTSSQMDDELSAADYKPETGGMKRRRRRRKREKESPLDDSSPQAASLIWCQHSRLFAAGSNCRVTLKHDHFQSRPQPPWLPDIIRVQEKYQWVL